MLLGTGLATRLLAVSGLDGTFEFACDAPWRIEPHRKADGSSDYGAIPIQISIHDANRAADDNLLPHRYISPFGATYENVTLPSALVSLGRFRAVHIRQLSPASTTVALYDLAGFHEIETVTGAWPWPSDAAHPRCGGFVVAGWATTPSRFAICARPASSTARFGIGLPR